MSARPSILALSALLLIAGTAFFISCKPDHAGSNEHGHGHDHSGHPGGGEEEPEPVSITVWTDRHELFVEFPPPLAGKPVRYHAHVTRLDGFQAVTEGLFRVRFRSSSGIAAETSINGVARPGIFTPEGAAPSAGAYTLEMVYEHGGAPDIFDCGPITISDRPTPPAPEGPSAAITFLKETQWRIPFATAWAEERALAREIELAAVVEPAGTEQLTIGAPTGGRFFHNPKLGLAEGLRIKKGELLGSIAPTVAGDDFMRLQLDAEEARLAKAQTEREIERVEPLVKQGLLPERRLTELKNDIETQKAKQRAAEARLSRVVAPGGAGGLPIKSAMEGLVTAVLVPNGEHVEAGAALLRLGGTERLWIRARFAARSTASLESAKPTGIRLATHTRIDIEQRGARFLSPLPVIDPASRIATWIVDMAPAAAPLAGTKNEAAPDIRSGLNVVLLARVGEPKLTIAIPRQAVVDINTRPFVFVQVDGEHFEKRAVTLGDSDGPFIQVLSGIAKGERVVTVGGFDIHLASLTGVIESHRH